VSITDNNLVQLEKLPLFFSATNFRWNENNNNVSFCNARCN